MRTTQNFIRLRRVTCLLRVLTIQFYRTVISVRRVQTLCTPPQSKSWRFRLLRHDDRVEWHVIFFIRPLSCDCPTPCSGTRRKLWCHSCRTELGHVINSCRSYCTLGEEISPRGMCQQEISGSCGESRLFCFERQYLWFRVCLYLVYHFPFTRISRHDHHSLRGLRLFHARGCFSNGENSSISCLLHCSYLPSSGLFLGLSI